MFGAEFEYTDDSYYQIGENGYQELFANSSRPNNQHHLVPNFYQPHEKMHDGRPHQSYNAAGFGLNSQSWRNAVVSMHKQPTPAQIPNDDLTKRIEQQNQIAQCCGFNQLDGKKRVPCITYSNGEKNYTIELTPNTMIKLFVLVIAFAFLLRYLVRPNARNNTPKKIGGRSHHSLDDFLDNNDEDDM